MAIFELDGWRILMVDDDADSVNMFAELLKHEKALVDKTQSSMHALQLLKTHGYDLLISDVNMPEMDGHQFIKEIRRLESNKDIIAIAMTGYGEFSDKEKTEISGFDIYLFKPASVKHIKSALAKHLSGERLENR